MGAVTAVDLMTRNPVSIRSDLTIDEVIAFLTDTGYSAAPVIDEAGRPVGVVSRTDVVVYDRARATSDAGTAKVVRAADLMTPAVFSVAPEATAHEVGREMVRLNVHRLYVVDDGGVLIGVISALDLLSHLCDGT